MIAVIGSRVLADLAGMALLGALTLRPFAGLTEADDRAAAWAGRFAAVWAAAAALNLVATAAHRTGAGLWRVDAAGLAAEIPTVPATAATIGIAGLLAAGGRFLPTALAIVLTAIGLVAGPVTGHLGLSVVGAAAIAVHVLAASWWFGGLAVMPLLLRGRAQWSACLSAFSRWAPGTVGLLVAGGAVAALIRGPAAGSPAWNLVAVKAAALVVVLVAAGWQRRVTLVRAARSPVARTRRAIGLEAGALAAITAVAAGLSYTG